ncbi:hypothetical protein CFN78_02615 [Amycolatopsis antarctica]|uniref:Uncharacterized protein n=1 Tax=Amycolatopsis antarctica TaxID=1854586 RepID=A0A263DC61_9PSEU|nr:hypothetical protein [Amycolatopsis antarctica]OZM75086.1 hypothetical protein CFN78_02615 [Amycolatopsis antarctica]
MTPTNRLGPLPVDPALTVVWRLYTRSQSYTPMIRGAVTAAEYRKVVGEIADEITAAGAELEEIAEKRRR